MKPSWNDAPAWAQYLAMDSDGSWNWFEYEPFVDRGFCYLNVELMGRYQHAKLGTIVEKRP